MGSLELSPSLTLRSDGIFWMILPPMYPSSTAGIRRTSCAGTPMEIALFQKYLKYLGFEGGIGDRGLHFHCKKIFATTLRTSYSYTAEFVLTGILKNNYLGYTSGTVTGVVGEGTAEQLLQKSIFTLQCGYSDCR